MIYHYRWLYAIGVYIAALSAIFYLHVYPLRQQYDALLSVMDEVTHKQHIPVKPVAIEDDAATREAEQSLLRIIRQANARLIKMHSHLQTYDLLVTAEFQALNSLLQYFFQHPDVISIQQFDFASDTANKLTLSIKFVLHGLFAFEKIPWSYCSALPFCRTDQPRVPAVHKAIFSVRQMQVAGRVESASGSGVVLGWPSGIFELRHVADIVGAEAAEITRIGERDVTLRFPDSHTVNVSYRNQRGE